MERGNYIETCSEQSESTGLEGPLEGHLSLCEALDRVLNKGVVICGDVTISVANVELMYLNLRLLVTSTETLRRSAKKSATKIGGFAHPFGEIGGSAFGMTDS